MTDIQAMTLRPDLLILLLVSNDVQENIRNLNRLRASMQIE